MLKTFELHEKTDEELYDLLTNKKERLRSLRFDLFSGKVKNIREIRKIKKEIARIFTIINLKALRSKKESQKDKI